MKRTVTIEINTDQLKSLTDEYLAALWAVAQVNPVPYDDPDAGELATRIGDEIIRRWLKGTPVEMYNHSSEQVFHRELCRHAIYVDGQWVTRTADTGVSNVQG